MIPTIFPRTSTPTKDFRSHFSTVKTVIRGHDVTGECEQERDGELGGGNGIASWCIHHDDAALGSGFDIDVVDSETPARPTTRELGRSFQRLPGHLCLASHDEPVIGGQRVDQIPGAHPGAYVDLGHSLQDLDSLGRDPVGDQNAKIHPQACSRAVDSAGSS